METDAELERLLFPEKQEHVSLRRMPDFEKVSKELARSGVTLKLLWMEYCEECRQLGEQPFMYSQFCYHFQKFAEQERATMHIPRKPGDRIEVDWAGDKLYIVDRDTGEAIPVYLFVGVLPFSMYAYAEGCLRMDMENWIHVHVNMFQYFGGSAVMLVPDNLKIGVDHAGDWYTPQINRTYRELAEHYNTAVVPARVRKPKDKSGAEGTVGVVSTRIIAALRNRKFFSLEELNRAIRRSWMSTIKRPLQKEKAAGTVCSKARKKPFCTSCRLPNSSWHSGEWPLSNTIITFP